MTQAVKEEYLAGVDRALLCYLPNRKELMAEARRMVDQFDEENPEATGEDLLAAFGTGEEFALSMLSTVPREQVEEAKRKTVFQRKALQVAVVLVLVVTAVFFFWRWQKAQEVVNGDFKVVIDPAVEITDEEAREFIKSTSQDAQSHTGG